LGLLVLPTPIGPGTVELLVGVSAWEGSDGARPAALNLVPPALLARAVRAFALLSLRQDVGQDRRVWETKRHLPSPVLAEGDGPIGLYRRWARQFMQEPVTGDHRAAPPLDGAPAGVQAGRWQTASTLLPSGSRTKAPK
jgi:hypothetical protein